jgi:hypothetical protein
LFPAAEDDFASTSCGVTGTFHQPGVLTTLAAAAAVLSAVLLTGASSQAMTRPRPGSTGVADGTWGRAQAVPEAAALADHHAWFTQLSCSSPGNCAGGGNYNTDADRVSPAFVVTEVHGTWQQAQPVPGLAALDHGGSGSYLRAVSCVPSGYCVLGGSYSTPTSGQAFVISEDNGRWGQAEEVPGTATLNKGGGAQLNAVSCPSAGNCTAGGTYTDTGQNAQAFVVSEHDGTWQDTRQVPGTSSGPFFEAGPGIGSISCPSVGNCSASGGIADPYTAFVVSERNGVWQRAELVPHLAALNTGRNAATADVSCPSAGNCGAGGFYWANPLHNRGDPNRAFTVSEVNGTWGKAQRVQGFAALHSDDEAIDSLSCSSPGNCIAAGTYGHNPTNGERTNKVFVVSETDGTWGAPQQIRGIPFAPGKRATVALSQISCTAPGDCAIGGTSLSSAQREQAFVVQERNGAWGTAEQVPGILALDKGGNADLGQLSCSSPEHCTAVGWFNGGTVKQPSWGLYAVSEPAGPGLADHRLHQASRALTSITSSSPSERRRQGES